MESGIQMVTFVYMQINEAFIDNLSNLSRLEFSDEEKLALKNDLERMISFVEKLKEVDTRGTEPLLHLSDSIDMYRQDVVAGSMEKLAALNNAPLASEHYFKVPKVIQK